MTVRPTRIFLHDDPAMAALFEDLASGLAASGAQVVRGRIDADELNDPQALCKRFEEVEIAVFSSRSRCPAPLLDAAPHLHGIVAPTIGTETIDVAAASARGILVGHGATPENVLSMAEATVLQILNLLYRPDLSESVLRGKRARPDGLARPHWARTLAGRRVGLVGYGRIGQAVAQRLLAFGADVWVANRSGTAPADAPAGLRFSTLREVLPQAEILTLHADARAGATPLIGAAELARLPAGALLVNTARGQLVDEAALVQALACGHVAAAALDTFVVEP
ncbi:MAG: NAD(P)-dependent oxidoreductase, partial [Achromobacter sp.]